MRRHKYGAVKTVVAGITFASKGEAHRFEELRLLEKAGVIRELELQPAYQLVEAVVLDGRKKPAIRYVADFKYVDVKTGKTVIEDVKGVATDAYRMKRHMMKALLGLDIVEIRR